MAEGGSYPYSVSTASDAMLDILCNPCDNSGNAEEADAYCTECKQYLCVACLKCHNNVTTTKDHKVLTNDYMPRPHKTSSASYVCIQPCQTHPNEVITHFCPVHKALGCDLCMTPAHDMCRRKVYIPDEAKGLAGSKEMRFVQASLDKMSTESENVFQSLQSHLEVSDDFHMTALEVIDTFRQKLNGELDILTANIEDIAKRDKDEMKSAADQANDVKAELQQMSNGFKTQLGSNQQCQAFITMKSAETKLADFQQQLDDASNVSPTAFTFQPSEELQKLVREKDALGELIVRNMADIRATHVADIKVKTRGNKKTCCITGSTVLSKDRLVIIDCDNETVKLVDTERHRVVNEYKPESGPVDVTRVNDRIAVTLPIVKKISFITCHDKLRLDKEIRVDYKCQSIAYNKDQLVVGCDNPSAVRLLTMEGQLLKTISASSTGEPLFSDESPGVIVSPYNDAIYADDFGNNTVRKLSKDGAVEAVYHCAGEMEFPDKMAVDELGVVYVPGLNSDNILALTPGCGKIKILLTARDGIQRPNSVSYCKVTRKLYVSIYENNLLKVYQLS